PVALDDPEGFPPKQSQAFVSDHTAQKQNVVSSAGELDGCGWFGVCFFHLCRVTELKNHSNHFFFCGLTKFPMRWLCGEIASCRATIAESIALAKELNDMHGLAVVLHFATILAYLECSPAEAERLASELIELATRNNFAHWLAIGTVHR